MISKRHYNFDAALCLCDIQTDIEVQQVHIKRAVWKGSRIKCFNDRDAFLMRYPSLSGAPRPPSLPSIRADDSSSRLGSSICKNMRRSSVIDWRRHITDLVFLWVCGVNVSEAKIRKPHQRTAVFAGGCVWALSAPGSSSSVLPGWCWFPSAHSPTFQKWPANQETLISNSCLDGSFGLATFKGFDGSWKFDGIF